MAVERLVTGAILELVDRQPVGGGEKRLVGERRVELDRGFEGEKGAADGGIGSAEDVAVVGETRLDGGGQLLALLLFRDGCVNSHGRGCRQNGEG
jgi:hypothetical protein